MSALANIRVKAGKLPEKDRELAKTLIDERRFTDLKYLVESSLKHYTGDDKMWIADMAELCSDIEEYMILTGNYEDDE